MKGSSRFGAALLALVLALLVAVPLPAARCATDAGAGCATMRGPERAMCHRDGSVASPMDCCKTRGAAPPATASDSVETPAPVALPANGASEPLAAFAALTAAAAALAAPVRVAEALHQLGLFTLLEVFRN